MYNDEKEKCAMNKRGSSNSGCGVIGTILIVAVVIIFRIAHELGPEYLTPSGIGRYLGEMAIFVAGWLSVSFVAKDERIQPPYSIILILVIVVVAAVAMYKLWRI